MNSKTTTQQELKDYCKYLIDEYSKIMVNSGGRLLINLKQFYEEGRIKDLFDKNASHIRKINFLNIFRKEIIWFAKTREIKLQLLTFQKFNQKLVMEIDVFKQIKESTDIGYLKQLSTFVDIDIDNANKLDIDPDDPMTKMKEEMYGLPISKVKEMQLKGFGKMKIAIQKRIKELSKK